MELLFCSKLLHSIGRHVMIYPAYIFKTSVGIDNIHLDLRYIFYKKAMTTLCSRSLNGIDINSCVVGPSNKVLFSETPHEIFAKSTNTAFNFFANFFMLPLHDVVGKNIVRELIF